MVDYTEEDMRELDQEINKPIPPLPPEHANKKLFNALANTCINAHVFVRLISEHHLVAPGDAELWEAMGNLVTSMNFVKMLAYEESARRENGVS
jgi:hypothetical protein